jgi:heat shock protein HtpX
MTHHNDLRTIALLGGMSVLVVVVGAAVDGRRGAVVAVVVAAGVNVYGYWYGDRRVLRAMRARPLSEVEAPQLYALVRELSATARAPMPRLYLSPTEAPNAFATGRDARHATLCCTRGLLYLLSERELRAVLAHELSHVYRRDALVASVAGALAGVVMWLATLTWLLPFGHDEDEDGGGLPSLLLGLLLGPLAATLVRLAVSRSREYRADLDAVRLTGDAVALASALHKLDRGTRMLPLSPEPELVAAGHHMIVDPFRRRGLARLFATHPPVSDRIARLEDLAGRR